MDKDSTVALVTLDNQYATIKPADQEGVFLLQFKKPHLGTEEQIIAVSELLDKFVSQTHRESSRAFIVDFSNVEQVNPNMLHLFIRMKANLPTGGKRIILAGMNEAVEHSLRSAKGLEAGRFEMLVEAQPTLKDAQSAAQKPPPLRQSLAGQKR